jgi:hypothetical protein
MTLVLKSTTERVQKIRNKLSTYLVESKQKLNIEKIIKKHEEMSKKIERLEEPIPTEAYNLKGLTECFENFFNILEKMDMDKISTRESIKILKETYQQNKILLNYTKISDKINKTKIANYETAISIVVKNIKTQKAKEEFIRVAWMFKAIAMTMAKIKILDAVINSCLIIGKYNRDGMMVYINKLIRGDDMEYWVEPDS